MAPIMRIFHSNLAILLALSAGAQDWVMFPVGQRSWYADSSMDPVQVELVVLDSSAGQGAVTKQFFHADIDQELFGACAAGVREQLPWLLPDGLYRMDSLVERHDTVLFFTPYSSLPVYFLPKAEVGEEWTVVSDHAGNSYGQIIVSCIAKEQRTFLGVTDSVKIFSMEADGASAGQVPVSDFNLVLSKHYGLVEFVPFVLFAYHPPQVDFTSWELLGWDSAGFAHGYRETGFHDFFDLSPGDILQWENESHSNFGLVGITYRRDSITAVAVWADSVQYTMDRRFQDVDQVFTYTAGITVVYRKSDWEGMLAAMPGYLAKGHSSLGIYTDIGGEPYWWAGPKELGTAPNGLDTVTSFSFRTERMALDTEYCNIGGPSDVSNTVQLDSWAGLTRMEWWTNPYTSISTLVGSRISGHVQGEISLGVGQDLVQAGAITVWPNPAVDRIHVELPAGAAGWRYELRDALGRPCGDGPLEAEGIGLSGLPAGIYAVAVNTAGRSHTARFVKR